MKGPERRLTSPEDQTVTQQKMIYRLYLTLVSEAPLVANCEGGRELEEWWD
jgi:hypothetical protein